MLKVGLTGGIGSGKSTITEMLKEKDIPVIDADKISRDIFQIYPEAAYKIRKAFGDRFFYENGDLKRRELGNFVFQDNKRKEKLEDITLPYITKEIFTRIEQYNKYGAKIIVIDAPTLIEVNLHKRMDFNILVWVDIDTQVERVKNRDLLSTQNIMNRINAQIPLDEKKKYVDFIIDNRGDLNHTKEQLEEILKIICRFEGKR